jgi:rhodanese-related sulfurtransferase
MRYLILFLHIVLMCSCVSDTKGQTKINTIQTEEMLRKDTSIQLIDLRTPGELQQTGCIPGARQINFNSPEAPNQLAQLDKQRPIVLYCAAGGRSARAAAKLRELGFDKVYDYAGGMSDWIAKGKTVKRSE